MKKDIFPNIGSPFGGVEATLPSPSGLPYGNFSDEPCTLKGRSLSADTPPLRGFRSDTDLKLDSSEKFSSTDLLFQLPYGNIEDPVDSNFNGKDATTTLLQCMVHQQGKLSYDEPPLPTGQPCTGLLESLKEDKQKTDLELSSEICQKIENEEKVGRVLLEDFTVNHGMWLVLDGVLCYYDQCFWRKLHDKDDAIIALRKVLMKHPSLYRTLTNSDYKSLYASLKTNPNIPHLNMPPRHRGQINFFDGVLDLDTEEVLPHRPEQHFFTFVNTSVYDVLSPPTYGNTFEEFVERAGNGDGVLREQLLEQILMAFAELDLKYLGYLVGPSHTGKSQFGAWLEGSLGPENIQVLRDINDFSDKWTVGSLAGKKLVSCWDVPDITVSKTAVGYIKMLVGDDTMKGEIKYGKIFSIRQKPHLIMASNFPLKIADAHKETALLNRVITIPFQNPVSESEMTQNLYEHLLHETPYILNQAMQAYHRFKERNFVPTKVDIPEEYQPQEGRQPVLTVEAFIKSSITAQRASEVSTSALYHAFLDFATFYDTNSMSELTFSKIFSCAISTYFPSAEPIRIYAYGRRCRGYRGIALQENNILNT